ncbi:MAG: ATP-binding protein, partial [Haloquadratum sp.]
MSNDTEPDEHAPDAGDDVTDGASDDGSDGRRDGGVDAPSDGGGDGPADGPVGPDERDRRRGNRSRGDVDGTIEDLGSDVEVDAEVADEVDEDDLLGGLKIDSTEEIDVPDRLVDQVIGQEHARDVVMKAAKQRRHVMMIGSPGTGKSMLAKAMSELLPPEELQDVLVYHNPDDGNNPKVRTVPAGKGEQIVEAHKEEARKRNQMRSFLMW